VEPAEISECLRALQRSIPFASFKLVTDHGVEYEIKTPDDIHFWPGGTRLAVASGGGYDPALELASIKLVKVDPVEKPLTDKIEIEIDHDIYERFCQTARSSHVSPEEETRRVITARALEGASAQITTNKES
jgi:hypothetical protein